MAPTLAGEPGASEGDPPRVGLDPGPPGQAPELTDAPRLARDLDGCHHDMIPPKTDPRWAALVTGTEAFPLKGLAARMMLTRVRLMGSREGGQAVAEAVDTAYDFFSKNLESAADDIRTIFG